MASLIMDKNSGIAQESTVFNNPLDSDIVLEFNGKKVHAHRAILRMSSPFLERVLQSQWPVAKGPTFSLGDDDDPEIIGVLLRHMYLLTYPQPEVRVGSNIFKFHIDIFMLADKYDCPSLHTLNNLIDAIARLCGPDAQQAADLSLRNEAVSVCAANYGRIFRDAEFQKRIKDGSLFDGEAMAKLLLEVGELASEKEYLRIAAHYSVSGQNLNHPSHSVPPGLGWNCLPFEERKFRENVDLGNLYDD